MKRIIYNNANGILSIVTPSETALEKYTIEQIAEKDVPAGVAYKIIDAADIPVDRTFRNAWIANEADLTDGVGGQHNAFIDDPAHPDYVAPPSPEDFD